MIELLKLFSIKPQYSNKIFNKEKLVEFRRQNVNVKNNEICLIYTTAPVKQITGYFIVKEKLRLPLNQLWQQTKKIGGITQKVFFDYFKGCEFGTAIIFKLVRNFRKSIKIFEIFPEFNAPQSYYTLDNDLYNLLVKKSFFVK